MAKGHSKGQNSHRPSDKGQKTRTFRNKTAQRARHQERQPNDRTVSQAKRWTVRATEPVKK